MAIVLVKDRVSNVQIINGSSFPVKFRKTVKTLKVFWGKLNILLNSGVNLARTKITLNAAIAFWLFSPSWSMVYDTYFQLWPGQCSLKRCPNKCLMEFRFKCEIFIFYSPFVGFFCDYLITFNENSIFFERFCFALNSAQINDKSVGNKDKWKWRDKQRQMSTVINSARKTARRS